MARCLTQWSILGPRFPSLLSDESRSLPITGARVGEKKEEEGEKASDCAWPPQRPRSPRMGSGGDSQSVQTFGCQSVYCTGKGTRVPTYLHPGYQQLRQACRLLAVTGIPRVELDHLREGLFIPPFCPPSSLRNSFRFTHTPTPTHPIYLHLPSLHFISGCLKRCSKAAVFSE
ncbi:hypothetical protein LZ32DRAFT_6493 [Colletotrichum eremochloae]|nr:hypothetical protein LZ32DRAFT_6493 [Colletotrichum eremochloae]